MCPRDTTTSPHANAAHKRPTDAEAALAVDTLIRYMGDDPRREGLRRTPKRAAAALRFLSSGYSVDARALANEALFLIDDAMGDDDDMGDEYLSSHPALHQAPPQHLSGLVTVRDIAVYSLCEHHLLPFHGSCTISYLPGKRVVGLSKLARVTDAYARRLQVQERLTQQIAAALWEVLEPRGILVVVECAHMCMAMRGVQQRTAMTTTRCALGVAIDGA